MGKRGTLAICLAAAFTTLLDQSSLNTAIPALRSSLGAGPGTLQWIIAGYSLTFGLALIPGGRLGDAHGRKWLFVGGVSLFTLGGVVAGTAAAAWVVAVARLAQGIGAGTVNPQVLGMIQDLFSGRERASALGAYATVGSLAGVIGPLVGGTLIGALGPEHGWRFVLLLNLPFGLLTVPLAVKWLPSARPARSAQAGLDLPGLALLAAATLCLLLPFVPPSGVGPPPLTWLPSALGFAIASSLSWRVVSRYGRISVVWALAGSLVTIAATVVVVLRVPAAQLGVALTLTQLAMGITGGLIISPNQALTLAHGPARSAGLASGFLQLAQRISATVTMAAVSGVVLAVTAGSARQPVAQGLIICGAMLVAAAALAAADCRTPPPPGEPARESLNKAVIHT